MERRRFIGQAGIVMAGMAVRPLGLAGRSDLRVWINGDLTHDSLFNNYWNRKVVGLKTDTEGAALLRGHTDEEGRYAGVTVQNILPYNVIADVEPWIEVFDNYQPERDPRKYLFPIADGKMAVQYDRYIAPCIIDPGEPYLAADGKDHHLIVVDTKRRKLYELYQPYKISEKQWGCWGSAIFDLDHYNRRDPKEISSDAAGLPILPGLIRYDELTGAEPIGHALRMTVSYPQATHWTPAVRHNSTGSKTERLPMGARVRLKKEGLTLDPDMDPYLLKIIVCLQEYGAIVADGGTNFALSGTLDPRWATLKAARYEPNMDCTFNLSTDQFRITGEYLEVIDREVSAVL